MSKYELYLFQKSIKALLLTHNIKVVDCYARVKTIDFIQKISAKPNDYLGARLILNSEEDCLTAGKLILGNYKILEGRYRDYISKPWPIGYKSIHIDLYFKNDLIEIQIRTLEMQKVCNDLILKKGNYYWRKPGFKKEN